jgi:hypothetical protein
MANGKPLETILPRLDPSAFAKTCRPLDPILTLPGAATKKRLTQSFARCI